MERLATNSWPQQRWVICSAAPLTFTEHLRPLASRKTGPREMGRRVSTEAGERRAGCHTTREPCAPGRSRRGVPPGGRGQGTGTVSPYLECRVSAGERVCLGS